MSYKLHHSNVSKILTKNNAFKVEKGTKVDFKKKNYIFPLFQIWKICRRDSTTFFFYNVTNIYLICILRAIIEIDTSSLESIRVFFSTFLLLKINLVRVLPTLWIIRHQTGKIRIYLEVSVKYTFMSKNLGENWNFTPVKA